MHTDSTGASTRTCPKCGVSGTVDGIFGTRVTKTCRTDGTLAAVERPQSWCRACRGATSSSTTRVKLAERVVELLGDVFETEKPIGGWPLRGTLSLPEGRLAVAAFLGRIGPSGRKRDHERRIQNPAKNGVIQPIDGRVSLLLGLDDPRDAEPVMILWNAKSRHGRATRYSAFLTIDDLSAAREHRLSDRTSSSGERIVAFTVDHLASALSLSLGDPLPMTEENDLDLEGLASALSALSKGEVPGAFSSSPSPFEPEDINWESNEWLTFVREIQHWLVLDQEITLDGGPVAAVEELFSGLAVDDTRECFILRDGVVSLSPIGFNRLEERISLAQARKEIFEQALADDFGSKQSTSRWSACWENEPGIPDLSTVEVHAKVDAYPIRYFKDLVEDDDLELNPSYQRDRVWSTSDSQRLVDSVLRGIPLPSIILNQRVNSHDQEIVDGKQRLTAILRFMGCHPEGVRYAESKSMGEATIELFRSDYRKWRRILGIKSPEETKHCLPFRLSTYKNDPLSPLSGRYYCEIRMQEVNIQGEQEQVRKLFSGTSNYKIPVILYKNTELQQIHRVFGLYNKQGKQLNAEELRNAIYHHLNLTKLMLVLGGDSHRPAELVPFAGDLDIDVVPSTFRNRQVGDSRFHRTKLASWVAAILVHQPNRTDTSIKTPSTSGYINAMLEAVSADSKHPMRDETNLRTLANAMIGGAALLDELAGEEDAYSPRFVSKKKDGVRWEDLPMVAAWTSCTLATLVGRTPGDAEGIGDAVRKATEQRAPLEKQQSRTQWGYLARTTFELLEAMGSDLEKLDRTLKQKLGFSCLPTLRDIDALKIKLV